MSLSVDFQLASDQPNLPDRDALATWSNAAFLSEADLDIGIRLVDAEESQTLNRQYRGKDKPTNVLSFPFDAPEGLPPEALPPYLGDLVICVPVVAQEADEQNKPELHHWAHLVVHGTLHLQGYDHINDDEAEEMEQLERDILAKLGIPDPYLADTEVQKES